MLIYWRLPCDTFSFIINSYVWQGTRPLCFIEEVPDKTMVAGYYENPDLKKRNEAQPEKQQVINAF